MFMSRKNSLNQWMLAAAISLFGLASQAQSSSEDSANNTPGFLSNGFKFSLNNGDYLFGMGGLIQPSLGMEVDTASKRYFQLNSRRTFFNVSGKAVKEKVSFFVQTDFNLASPLMDAWIAYQAHPRVKVTLGQTLTFANNREMTWMEGQLQFLERSLLSTQYAATGREFGLFLQSNLMLGSMVFEPMLAVTSGDGRNSFGASPTDFDLGGLKYAGRLDWYLFGKFSETNGQQVADMVGESKPKVLIGAAASVNRGASHVTGEGHGNFLLYDAAGKNLLPDYRKLYVDVLAKYKGFSLLGEYVVATGKVAQETFKDITGLNRMRPTEISQFLALGTGINGSVGYVWRKSLGVDIRYAFVEGEFANNPNSLVEQKSELALGLTKYINEQHLKINAHLSYFNTSTNSNLFAAFWVQLMF
jgi:hypothetical protein